MKYFILIIGLLIWNLVFMGGITGLLKKKKIKKNGYK